jgi:alpha/beta hydrolase fold
LTGAVVFHHGWPLSSDDWDTQMLFFVHHGYRVIGIDRRGHGRSSHRRDAVDAPVRPQVRPAHVGSRDPDDGIRRLPDRWRGALFEADVARTVQNARSFIRWTAEDLAAASALSVATIRRAELKENQTALTSALLHRPVRPAVTIVTKACVCNYSLREPFFCCRFRSRTPGPPPFSSMNSTPADSNARRIAKSLT